MKRFITAIALAALGMAPTVHAAPSGTFRQAHEVGFGNASDVDPISKGRVFAITEKIMNRLVRPGIDGKPAPDLAVSWSSNSAATEWTFKLRENVKFHNGKAFSSADAMYSLKRVLDPKIASPARGTVSMIKDVEAPDAKTLKLILTTPFADMPLVLTDYRLMMIPDGSGDTIKTTGIGTGPFKIEKLDPQGTTVLVANNDYFDGPPGVAKMEIIGIPDEQARFQALMGKQIDLMQGITRQQRQLLERSGSFSLNDIPTGNWRGIDFRTDTKPSSSRHTRKVSPCASCLSSAVQASPGSISTAPKIITDTMATVRPPSKMRRNKSLSMVGLATSLQGP